MRQFIIDRGAISRLAGATFVFALAFLTGCTASAPVGEEAPRASEEMSDAAEDEAELPVAPPVDSNAGEIGATVESKNLNIEFLYLDLSVCGPCQGTEAVLDEAIAEVRPVLEGTGFHLNVTKMLVDDAGQAEALRFVSSPTIRINGRDLQPDVKEELCNSCSGLCGDDVECRVWVYEGEQYWAPPKPMIVTAIMAEAYGGGQYTAATPAVDNGLPDNLKRFFAAKENPGSADSGCCPSSTKCCG